MRTDPRVVLDTNALISRLLLPDSIPARAVRKAVNETTVLASDETLFELADVLARPKFDPYLSIAERQAFMRRFTRIAEVIPVVHRIQACRDPSDDIFLALAVSGEADLIVSGDRGLLTLHPFRDITIQTPADYLAAQ
jgi:putative PIN family toxin of toxin-antitoxin system